MILHALQQKTIVVVCSKDTNVLGLMVFIYALNKIYEKWAMKNQSNKFIDTRKIGEYLRTDVTTKFSQIDAATGRDKTSFLHIAGKIKVSQQRRKADGVSCKTSDTIVEDVEKFIQTVCYPEREEESFTETTIL